MASRTGRLAVWSLVAAFVLAACGGGGAVRTKSAGHAPSTDAAAGLGTETTSTSSPAVPASSTTTASSTGSASGGTGYAEPAGTVVAYPSPPPPPPPPPRTTTTAPPPPLPVNGSGVHGRITAGPTCPVERVDQPCPPRPVEADVEAVSSGSGVVAGRTHSDTDGRYAMSLAPGDYDLHVVTANQFPRCSDKHVTVRPGEVTTADIDCDTGIR